MCICTSGFILLCKEIQLTYSRCAQHSIIYKGWSVQSAWGSVILMHFMMFFLPSPIGPKPSLCSRASWFTNQAPEIPEERLTWIVVRSRWVAHKALKISLFVFFLHCRLWKPTWHPRTVTGSMPMRWGQTQTHLYAPEWIWTLVSVCLCQHRASYAAKAHTNPWNL